MSDEENEVPNFLEMQQPQAHAVVCADYLRLLAHMIEQGQIAAFDISWSTQVAKPQGKMVMQSVALIGPMEVALREQVEAHRQKIQVEDLTEQLKNHPACPVEKQKDCPFCSVKLS